MSQENQKTPVLEVPKNVEQSRRRRAELTKAVAEMDLAAKKIQRVIKGLPFGEERTSFSERLSNISSVMSAARNLKLDLLDLETNVLEPLEMATKKGAPKAEIAQYERLLATKDATVIDREATFQKRFGEITPSPTEATVTPIRSSEEASTDRSLQPTGTDR